MKKIFFLIISILLVSGCINTKSVSVNEIKKENVKMNICWMLPAGVGEAMKSQFLSDLKANGIDADIKIASDTKDFNFNDMVNCQVAFVDEFVGAIVIKDNSNWRVVSRTNNLRIGVLAPKDSKINSFKDLEGKIVGGHVGGIIFLDKKSGENNMDPKSSFSFLPMDDEEIRSVILKSNGKDWGKIDSIIALDNLFAYFQIKDNVKIIDQGVMVLPVLARNDYIQNNPEAMVNFYKAFSSSLNSFRKNMISEKKLSIEGMPEEMAPSIYKLTYEKEENFDEQGMKPFRFYFNKEEIDSLQRATDLVFDFPFTKPRINIMDFIDLSYMQKALESSK